MLLLPQELLQTLAWSLLLLVLLPPQALQHLLLRRQAWSLLLLRVGGSLMLQGQPPLQGPHQLVQRQMPGETQTQQPLQLGLPVVLLVLPQLAHPLVPQRVRAWLSPGATLQVPLLLLAPLMQARGLQQVQVQVQAQALLPLLLLLALEQGLLLLLLQALPQALVRTLHPLQDQEHVYACR